ncbi:Alpha-lytic protease prodomain-containing protein [Lentzea fradiae]|uniref:Alpha-lytic protease prodomain-containing protein n=1 Tax=Lentzea fradiae TaxID=200378 RepID=A0A1G7NQJ7_9PSEU|nr:S1 family peptidase [Lentzea fradiae]SDF75579.1 Alpha-lytic protease prodomain-containing protein [Lentzea fradiae]
MRFTLPRITSRVVPALALVLVGSTFTVPAPASAEELSPGLLTAMTSAFGLTEAQARLRIEKEERASVLAPRAEAEAGAAYAGSWFDDKTNRLVVAVTDRAVARSVEATGVDTVVVGRSANSMAAHQKRLDALSATGAVPAAVASWHPDPRTGTVVVNVEAGKQTAEVAKFLDKARQFGAISVNTEGVQQPKPYAAGTVGGDPYYTGNVRCSIGFSVHGGYVTAGHCGGNGQAVYGWDRSFQGNFAGSSFPGNDYAWVRIGGGWWTVPVVLGWGTVADALVRGSWEAPVGTSVCRSGSTTRWHCGVVQSRNETIRYAQGDVHQMAGTSVCAEGGDSGGSFITGDQAQGVTSGGYGNCSSGGRTWFQPINEILNVYGLRLHTA